MNYKEGLGVKVRHILCRETSREGNRNTRECENTIGDDKTEDYKNGVLSTTHVQRGGPISRTLSRDLETRNRIGKLEREWGETGKRLCASDRTAGLPK